MGCLIKLFALILAGFAAVAVFFLFMLKLLAALLIMAATLAYGGAYFLLHDAGITGWAVVVGTLVIGTAVLAALRFIFFKD